jgi:hypothetical protein
VVAVTGPAATPKKTKYCHAALQRTTNNGFTVRALPKSAWQCLQIYVSPKMTAKSFHAHTTIPCRSNH